MSKHDVTSIQRAWLYMLTRNGVDECWVYDPTDHAVHTLHFNELGQANINTYDNPRERAITTGMVHPSSVDAFNAFFDDMVMGLSHGEIEIVFRPNINQGYCWYRLSFTTDYSESGEPLCAIGFIYKLEQKDKPAFMQPHIPDTIFANLLRMGVANLRSGNLEMLLERNGDQISLRRNLPYETALQEYAMSSLRNDEREGYLAQLNLHHLHELYDAGTRWTIGRYHIIQNSLVVDMRIGLNTRRNAQGDLIVYSYTSKSDSLSTWESNCGVAASYDDATGLYMREYAQLIASSILVDDTHTMSALGVMRFAESEPVPDYLKNDLARALNVFLDTDCITYRFDKNCIGMFFPSIESENAIQRRVESAIESARNSLLDAHDTDALALTNLHLVSYVIYATHNYLEVNTAAQLAYDACMKSDIPPQGDFVNPPCSYPIATGQDTDETTSFGKPNLDHLAEKEARFCASLFSKMLNSGSAVQSIGTALNGLGDYYKARRVYLVSVTLDQNQIAIPYEWTAPNVAALKGRFSSTNAHRFPFIVRNLNATHPVYVSKPRIYTGMNDKAMHQEAWRFCLIPINYGDRYALVLCIDNPAHNLGQWNVAIHVAQHIFREWNYHSFGLLQQRKIESTNIDIALDGQALEHALSHVDGGAWKTLGVMVVTVVHPADLVQRSGLTYALNLFEHIRETLNTTFFNMPVFHTNDTEFVALFPNSAYPAFIQRCAQVRSELTLAHGNEITIGSSWSDNPREAWSAIGEARCIARTETAITPEDNSNNNGTSAKSNAKQMPRSLESVPVTQQLNQMVEDLSQYFCVYIQPKIDNRTGELVGAEAFCRLIDDPKRTHVPMREIEQMEAKGSIYRLDYYIFNQVLGLMSRWQDQTGRTIPISTNFSRTTLLNPRALASILAIASHYPELNSNNIELEITESAIDLGKANLSDLVNRYRSIGLRVALDDFGVHYSDASILANVHFDTIKLDRTIVAGLPDNSSSSTLVKNIIKICTEQNIACIAEGVETSAQAAALAQSGCFICQGFFYDKAMSPKEFERKYLDTSN